MTVTDPREEYDDLIIRRQEVTLDADEFASMRDSEAVRADWVAIGVVLNAQGQVLLAYNGDVESWLLPGGALQAGESLSEGLVRGIREETGVPVTPNRPRALDEFVCHHGTEIDGFRAVVFDANPESTKISDDLGEPGELIKEARWFHDLPENVFERKSSVEVLARCRAERT
jgi:8-oxo-dGTP diphosphatase